MDDDEIMTASSGLRRGMADLLESLDESQWDTASLCSGWTVRQVAAHLLAAISTPIRVVLWEFLRSGFRMDAFTDRAARRIAERSPAELLAGLREHADARFAPPVVGAHGPLTDLLVHEGDIRLPLGLPLAPPLPETEVALEFLTGRAPGFVPRGRLTGLRLAPDDLDRAWGGGAEVTGRAADLLMAVCGRPETLPALAGPGVPVLRARLRAPMPIG